MFALLTASSEVAFQSLLSKTVWLFFRLSAGIGVRLIFFARSTEFIEVLLYCYRAAGDVTFFRSLRPR